MTEQKSKGQLLAEEFNRLCKEKGLPPIPIRKPDRPKIWVTIHPVKPVKSNRTNKATSSESTDKGDV